MGDSLCSVELRRAGFSAAVFAAVAWLTGGSSLSAIAVEAALQGGASVSSDLVHLYVLRSVPSALSGPSLTGAIYTAYKSVAQGDNAYVGNFLLSAGTDWASDHVAAMLTSPADGYVAPLPDQSPQAQLTV